MLPLIVTVCLSRGARAMASGKAIVRRLDAIETLGGMDVLCVDKTGTPTSGVIKLDRAQSMSGLNSSYVLHAAWLTTLIPHTTSNPVVPERLRTLDHGRPWRDDQFAACRVSSSRDMSR